jgi:predicted signal transduction protein with EAL and GGDEF domain
MHLDELKLDKSFVGSVLERPADLAIVRAMVSLAGGLDLTVTAEGVEDEATPGCAPTSAATSSRATSSPGRCAGGS